VLVIRSPKEVLGFIFARSLHTIVAELDTQAKRLFGDARVVLKIKNNKLHAVVETRLGVNEALARAREFEEWWESTCGTAGPLIVVDVVAC
jgi:hypothetical protein